MAVDHPDIVSYLTDGHSEGADVLGDHNPALRHRRREHTPIVNPAKLGPCAINAVAS